MSIIQHLHPDIALYLKETPEERILFLKKEKWIGHPKALKILEKLEDLLDHPRGDRMPNMLIIGNSNNGKTKLIKRFIHKYPACENLDGDNIIAPVLYIQAPPVPSELGFYTSILSALFVKVTSSSTDAKRLQVIKILKAIQLKILVIDELHNILAGASIKQQQFLNMIKFLSNELQISIVGCGTSDLLRAVSIDPQIQNRFIPELLPKWNLDKEYLQLLASFEMTLPLLNRSKIYERNLASKIYAMTEGTIGELSSLLRAASILAIKSGKEQITLEILNECEYISPSDRTPLASQI